MLRSALTLAQSHLHSAIAIILTLCTVCMCLRLSYAPAPGPQELIHSLLHQNQKVRHTSSSMQRCMYVLCRLSLLDLWMRMQLTDAMLAQQQLHMGSWPGMPSTPPRQQQQQWQQQQQQQQQQ